MVSSPSELVLVLLALLVLPLPSVVLPRGSWGIPTGRQWASMLCIVGWASRHPSSIPFRISCHAPVSHAMRCLLCHRPVSQAVNRELRSPFGMGMDTWVVSRKPVGLYRPPIEPQVRNTSTKPVGLLKILVQPYLFFYKAHILAGQVRPDGKSVLDFAWLSKEEIAPRVDKEEVLHEVCYLRFALPAVTDSLSRRP